jgi:hypothetical protein
MDPRSRWLGIQMTIFCLGLSIKLTHFDQPTPNSAPSTTDAEFYTLLPFFDSTSSAPSLSRPEREKPTNIRWHRATLQPCTPH